MVVLSQSDHISFSSYFQTTATADFHIWTFELSDQSTILLKHGHMESVAMAVSHNYVSSVTDVDAIRIVSDILTANTPHKIATFIENHHTVTLQGRNVTLYNHLNI